MGGHCDICGDIGVTDAIITCCKCKINSEHMYCMRIPLEEYVDDWICEECESSSKSKPPVTSLHGELTSVTKVPELCAESKLPNELKMVSTNWEKKVERGKTKYISVNEAIKLSSGEIKSSAPLIFTWRSKPKQAKVGLNVLERTTIRRKTVPLSFTSQKDLASGPSRPPKFHRLHNDEISERQLLHSTKPTEVLRPVSNLQLSQAPKNGHMQMQREQPIDVQWAQRKTRGTVRNLLSTPSLNVPPLIISGGSRTSNELRINDPENMTNNVMPDLEKCSCSPALDALWKGSFSIPDGSTHGGANHQIEAHPPSRARKKVYELSRKMPEVLNFQLVPANAFWIHLFKEATPDDRDIALYFFPTVRERSKDYIVLLEHISLRDLALREQIADVELLVFTSKLLPDNYQRWKGKYYLWGVFHRLKPDTTGSLHLSEQPVADVIHAHDQVDDGEEDIDMEIDMIGGTNVGRIDVPVRKEPHQPVMGRASDPVTVTAAELSDLIPPGFEEVFKRRFKVEPIEQ